VERVSKRRSNEQKKRATSLMPEPEV
jgi:hypothetical protein